jgi:hypothetical protein
LVIAFLIAFARWRINGAGGLYSVICGYVLKMRRVGMRLSGPVVLLTAFVAICSAILGVMSLILFRIIR